MRGAHPTWVTVPQCLASKSCRSVRRGSGAAHVTEIRTQQVAAQTIVVAPTGDLDLVSADDLADALDSAFASVPSVVLDLSDVTFIDSSGIAALVATARTVELRICAASDVARRVIEISGLADALRLAP